MSRKQEAQDQTINYGRRRLVAGATAGALLLGGAAAAKELKQDYDKNQETEFYSQPNLADQYKSEDGQSVQREPDERLVMYTIRPGDTADEIATAFGAKDHGQVSREIVGQSGGAGSLDPGEEVVIPVDQIDEDALGIDRSHYGSSLLNTGKNAQGDILPFVGDDVPYVIPIDRSP